MASWLIKALVQRGIAALPNPHFWNGLLQERITRSVRLTDELFEEGLQLCSRCFEHIQSFKPEVKSSFSVFELGTGWCPVVPIGLFLSGAREISTWDIIQHLTVDRLKLTIKRFLDSPQTVEKYLNPGPDRWLALRSLMMRCESSNTLTPTELLEPLGIHYRIGDAAKSDVAAESVNLIVSNGVLEYLSPEILANILKEFRRVAAPAAVMSHTIDLGDQYASFDSKITPFNFLRFSDRQWKWLNNPIIPLNRLRISDYRRAFQDSGFQIVDEVNRVGDASTLARTTLAPRFRDYAREDLLVLHSVLTAIPQGTAPLMFAARASH